MRVSESYGITVRMALFSHFSKIHKLCDAFVEHQLRPFQGLFTRLTRMTKAKVSH